MVTRNPQKGTGHINWPGGCSTPHQSPTWPSRLLLCNEPKRRNVLRLSAACLVVPWLTLQVANVILYNITFPDWVFKSIMPVPGFGPGRY